MRPSESVWVLLVNICLSAIEPSNAPWYSAGDGRDPLLVRQRSHALRGHHRLDILDLKRLLLAPRRLAQCAAQKHTPHEKVEGDDAREVERFVDELRELVALP